MTHLGVVIILPHAHIFIHIHVHKCGYIVHAKWAYKRIKKLFSHCTQVGKHYMYRYVNIRTSHSRTYECVQMISVALRCVACACLCFLIWFLGYVLFFYYFLYSSFCQYQARGLNLVCLCVYIVSDCVPFLLFVQILLIIGKCDSLCCCFAIRKLYLNDRKGNYLLLLLFLPCFAWLNLNHNTEPAGEEKGFNIGELKIDWNLKFD